MRLLANAVLAISAPNLLESLEARCDLGETRSRVTIQAAPPQAGFNPSRCGVAAGSFRASVGCRPTPRSFTLPAGISEGLQRARPTWNSETSTPRTVDPPAHATTAPLLVPAVSPDPPPHTAERRRPQQSGRTTPGPSSHAHPHPTPSGPFSRGRLGRSARPARLPIGVPGARLSNGRQRGSTRRRPEEARPAARPPCSLESLLLCCRS